jgi:hypothetical protein
MCATCENAGHNVRTLRIFTKTGNTFMGEFPQRAHIAHIAHLYTVHRPEAIAIACQRHKSGKPEFFYGWNPVCRDCVANLRNVIPTESTRELHDYLASLIPATR